MASLVTSHGRSTPLLWMTLQKSVLKGNRAEAEDTLLHLKHCVPEGVKVVTLYGRRFTCEETFRDIEDLRFGMGLAELRGKSPERRDKLLRVSALAQALMTLLGAAGESLGMEKGVKANAVKTRTYPHFGQGCMYCQAMPMMKEERLLPLVQRFSELLHAHRVFRDAFGFI